MTSVEWVCTCACVLKGIVQLLYVETALCGQNGTYIHSVDEGVECCFLPPDCGIVVCIEKPTGSAFAPKIIHCHFSQCPRKCLRFHSVHGMLLSGPKCKRGHSGSSDVKGGLFGLLWLLQLQCKGVHVIQVRSVRDGRTPTKRQRCSHRSYEVCGRFQSLVAIPIGSHSFRHLFRAIN